MNFRKAVIFLLYGTAVTGFCLHQHQIRRNLPEEIQPYLHYYLEESTEIPETSEIPETEKPSVSTEPAVFTETEAFTEVSETLPESETAVLPETEPETPSEEIHFPLELNRATLEELCALPEIGEATAQKIISYREENGGFLNRQQLLEISGIGEYKYSLILPYLYLETEYPLSEPEPEPQPEPEMIPETEFPEPPEETVPPEIPVINLNTAQKEDLLLLPDCDEELAEEILILRDRDIHMFHNILEIMHAEHVTKELFLKWENYLSVDEDGNTQIF